IELVEGGGEELSIFATSNWNLSSTSNGGKQKPPSLRRVIFFARVADFRGFRLQLQSCNLFIF
ncbi:hypothetical protein PanWU01x14_043650, partial [Parasponia andersonii]